MVRLAVSGGSEAALDAVARTPAPASTPAPTPPPPARPVQPGAVEAVEERQPEVEPAAASPIEPAAGTQEAWTRVLEELAVSARGILKQAKVDFEGDTVVAVYPYKGQYDVAMTKHAEVARLVTAHFGPGTGFEIRLLPLNERGVPARPESSLAPEDHPTVVEALNALGGRVIDIKEIHE